MKLYVQPFGSPAPEAINVVVVSLGCVVDVIVANSQLAKERMASASNVTGGDALT